MSLFYFLVARSMAEVETPNGLLNVTAENLKLGSLQAGKLTSYTANVLFSLGIVLSNFLFNTAVMLKPFQGEPVAPSQYFQGSGAEHLWGVLGGCIWGVGMGLNLIASNVAGFAISYGLGQGATLVAAIWGVFIWREFRHAPPGANRLIWLMFVGYIVGLGFVITAKLM